MQLHTNRRSSGECRRAADHFAADGGAEDCYDGFHDGADSQQRAGRYCSSRLKHSHTFTRSCIIIIIIIIKMY